MMIKRYYTIHVCSDSVGLVPIIKYYTILDCTETRAMITAAKSFVQQTGREITGKWAKK